MRALVTGATGFVGGHVAEALVGRGDAVVCLARKPEAAARFAALGARVAPGSLEDRESLERALDGVEVVYHLAGLTAAFTESEFFAVNEGGTRRLVEAARRAAPALRRFVYVSTQAALGPSQPGQRLGEDAPCHPISAYGRSKLAGETVVRGAAGLPWVIVRPPVVYGPRDREFLRLFRLARLGVAPVFGRGAQQLSMVFAPDLADAVVRAGSAEGAPGRVYHAAHPEVVTYRDVGRAIGRAIGRAPLTLPVPIPMAAAVVWAMERAAAAAGRRSVVSVDRLAEFRAPAWILAVEKAERELGWRAAHDLERGTRATAEWYRAEGWLG